MKRTILIAILMNALAPAGVFAASLTDSLPDAASAKKVFDTRRDQYEKSNYSTKGYTYGDPIEESRGMYQAYSKNSGESEIVYHLSFPEETSTSRLLVANGEILVTLSSTGSVDIWDSRSLDNIISVWTDICELDASGLYDYCIWYGYNPRSRNFRLFCVGADSRSQEIFDDKRLFVDLGNKKIDSVNLMYQEGNYELPMGLASGEIMPVARPVFKVPGGHTDNDATMPTLKHIHLSNHSLLNASEIVSDYAFDFPEGKGFDWSRVNVRTLSINAKAPANTELPAVSQMPGLPQDGQRHEIILAPSGCFVDVDAPDGRSVLISQFENGNTRPKAFFYSAKHHQAFPLPSVDSSLAFVKDVLIGESDCGHYVMVNRGEYKHVMGDSFPILYDKGTGKYSNLAIEGRRYSGGSAYPGCGQKFNYPSSMSAPDYAIRTLDGDSNSWGEYYIPGDASELNVWNRIPGRDSSAYWIKAGGEICSLYRMDDKRYKGEEIQKLPYVQGESKPYWDNGNKLLFLPNGLHSWKVYRVDVSVPRATFICHAYDNGNAEYAFVLPNGHYAGSPGCESFLLMAPKGEKPMSLQALAPWRNRPAEVMDALGGNAEDVEVLRQTTRRWLARQGINLDAMPPEPAFKDFARVEVDMPRLLTTDAEATFDVKLCPGAKDIARLIVRADGVEIPQTAATSTSGRVAKSVSVTVPLATRENWIEVTPVDSDGISGDTARFRVIRQGSAKPDLYIVSLGVSKYNDESLNLQYAAKDARDLAAAFEKYGCGSKKHVLVLTDNQVKDKSCLERVKGFLSAATVEDRVVFYCAGHGLLDEKLDYYFAPAGIDVEDVAATGISMKELQSAIEETPARDRLLLLDTCHAGSVGEEDEDKLAIAGALPHGVRAIQHRGMKVKKAAAALNTAQRKRYIEEMFSMGEGRRGVNVIAGSAGAEYAQESDEWNNGVFTSAVIECLKRWYRADDNQDSTLSLAELNRYVTDRVAQLTGGAQVPKASALENSGRMAIHAGGTLNISECADLLSHFPSPSGSGGVAAKKLKGLIDSIAKGNSVNMRATDGSGDTALICAAQLGNIHLAKALLAMGADPIIENKNHDHASYLAQGPVASLLMSDQTFKDKSMEIIRKQQLLGSSTSIGSQPQPTYQPAYQPAPVLYTSTEDRSDLQPLLDRMAALRCKHASSAEQQRHLLQLLPMIRDGASVDVVAPDDPYRRTALHYSCAIGSLGITTWLVDHGANVNAADANGKTPLSMVGADNRAAITKLLKQHGAGSTAGQAAAAPPEDGPTDPGEQCNLGYKYQYGKDGYKQSYDKAFYWYKKAADQGLAVAINNLGFCYQNGWGCSKSESKAFTCYKQAAELGVPLAMSNLGTCYEFGNGTRANRNLAVEWYRKAARLGNPSAQKHLKRLKLSW